MDGTDTQTDIHLLLVDGDPVGGCKPLVSLDVVDPVLEISVTFCEIHLKITPNALASLVVI